MQHRFHQVDIGLARERLGRRMAAVRFDIQADGLAEATQHGGVVDHCTDRHRAVLAAGNQQHRAPQLAGVGQRRLRTQVRVTRGIVDINPEQAQLCRQRTIRARALVAERMQPVHRPAEIRGRRTGHADLE